MVRITNPEKKSAMFISLLLFLIVSFVNPCFATKITSGTKSTTAGTAVQLSDTSTNCDRVIVVGAEGNTDVVVVGGPEVDATQATRKGIALFPGQIQTLEDVTNILNVYMDVEVNDEDVEWICINR